MLIRLAARSMSVSHVDIERAANRINIAIHTGKPGMVIGKGGSEMDCDVNTVSSTFNVNVRN
jgi:small subunit ribosomal protein S3